jgi:hypothetical protein
MSNILVRRETRKTKREYLKDRNNGFETNSRNKSTTEMYKCTIELEKRYQARTNLLKDGNSVS